MSFSLLPEFIFPSLTDLTPEFLRREGIRLLMLDFDNTIVPYTTNIPTKLMDKWFDAMKREGIRICVVSNSRKGRVPDFCRERGIDCVTRARKPSSKKLLECVRRYQLPREQCAMVGDQIFTDTLAANRACVHSILVKPIHNHNFWLKARHGLEQPFIKAAKRRMNHEKS